MSMTLHDLPMCKVANYASGMNMFEVKESIGKVKEKETK